MMAVLTAVQSPASSHDAPPGHDHEDQTAWPDALLAARLFAVDPAGLGGVVLRARPGPVRDRWMEIARSLFAPQRPFLKVPLHIGDDRLLGGLDLSATLKSGRPVAQAGLLCEADAGVVVLPMAERLEPATAARIAGALDTNTVRVARDGFSTERDARFGVIACDEGADWDERAPGLLRDRLALHLDLTDVSIREASEEQMPAPAPIAADQLTRIEIPEEAFEALCATALALGVESMTVSQLAVRTARAAAALDGSPTVTSDHAAIAARLVLAPRATRLPAPDREEEDPAPPDQPPEDNRNSEDDLQSQQDGPMEDRVLEAAQASIPAGLLAQLQAAASRQRSSGAGGRVGASRIVQRGGRPVGSRRGEIRAGARVHVLDTLRVAAPWQPVRRATSPDGSKPRIHVTPDDVRITRFKKRRETVTIFVVDASGSAALHRLAEAKGAVELLLTESYVRRDEVALIAFRGQDAELLLPPTRSLVRTKRALAVLPGGGGTPLASAIDLARTVADSQLRQGRSVTLVFLTDGRGNIARDGSPGREIATSEAEQAAKSVALLDCRTLVVDISTRRGQQAASPARTLATAMDAVYLPLPRADAQSLSRAVQATGG